MCFAIFPYHLCKVLRMPRKSAASSYKVLHLSCKIILANLTIWCSKMQPFPRYQRPYFLTYQMKIFPVLRLPCDMHLCGSSSNIPRLPPLLRLPQDHQVWLVFVRVHNLLRLSRKMTVERPKVVRTWCFFYHFDFEVRFAPQPNALFQQLHRNLLRATAACNFLISRLAR